MRKVDKKTDEYDHLNDLLGINSQDHEKAFRWFGRQGFSVRQRILTNFHEKLQNIEKDLITDSYVYKIFLKSIIENGWKISEKIRSKQRPNTKDLKIAEANEIEKALTYSKQYRTTNRFKKIHANTSLILQLRQEGMTYKDIALYFTNVKKLKVSQATISRIIKKYNKQNDVE
jgi:hypothetical protein